MAEDQPTARGRGKMGGGWTVVSLALPTSGEVGRGGRGGGGDQPAAGSMVDRSQVDPANIR